MQQKARCMPSLDQPATYEIKVPGHLDEIWTESDGGMDVTVKRDDDYTPVTTLAGVVDQASLHG